MNLKSRTSNSLYQGLTVVIIKPLKDWPIKEALAIFFYFAMIQLLIKYAVTNRFTHFDRFLFLYPLNLNT